MAIRQWLAILLLLTAAPLVHGEDQESADNGADAANGEPPATEAATPPPPPKNPPLPLDLQRGRQIAEQFSQDKEKKATIHWFREGQKNAFLGLYTENYGRDPQGYALILHDNQQHPDWPGIVHYLRSQLPAKGWSTLAISLPNQWKLTDAPPREAGDVVVQPAVQNPDTEAGDAENNNANAAEKEDPKMAPAQEKAADDGTSAPASAAAEPAAQQEISYTQLSVAYPPEEIPNIIQGRLTEALNFLQGRDPMPIIVIAVGTSATFAARQVHTLRMKDIAGLVIVDAMEVEQEGFDVNSDAPGLRIPVLDVVPEFNPRANPEARLRAARREARPSYEQQIISGADGSFAEYEEFLTKAIRGWARRKITDKSRFGYL